VHPSSNILGQPCGLVVRSYADCVAVKSMSVPRDDAMIVGRDETRPVFETEKGSELLGRRPDCHPFDPWNTIAYGEAHYGR
jgi:hypothetical protein